MAYNTPESVADYLSRFQMQVTERTKGTFSPMHVKYSLALKMGSSSFETTFQSNPNVHGEPTVTQVFGALASDAMLARDYGMDEFASLSEVIGENESEVGALVEQAASERAARHAYDHPEVPKGFVTIDQLRDMGVYAIRESLADEILNDLSYDEDYSVDSEAHDMENGRDGLDGNAPEKDAPEKDDRDAQPPVDTDNR